MKNNVPNSEVIEKCIEVLAKTDDGNRLTDRELSLVEWLTNHYYQLIPTSAKRAVRDLERLIRRRGT